MGSVIGRNGLKIKAIQDSSGARMVASKDMLPQSVKINKMNGVARGAYKHYDAIRMAGLPVGVQVVGRRLEEEKVLACMERVEEALDAKGEKYELLEVPEK